jgi:CheY-like chemotaxis protein
MGTGLGLAVVRGIVRKYGGSIGVSSKIGRGTVFTVLLPRIVSETAALPHAPDPESASAGARILLIDDEEALVELGRDILDDLGYLVECSTDPVGALDIFRTYPERFDLVISDMTMPQMSGEVLAQNLTRIRADIPIVLCLGFNEVISDEKARRLGIRALVMKPLNPQDLAKTVHLVLDVETN